MLHFYKSAPIKKQTHLLYTLDDLGEDVEG